jgi:hypothetical protein
MRSHATPNAAQRFRSMLALGVTALLGALLAPALLGRPLYSLFIMSGWGFWRAWVWHKRLRTPSVEQDARQHVGEDPL